MKIRKLSLDGYGCFARSEFEFDNGIQIITGPNEHGKTTMRSFIADMLYGQKSSPTQRRYDDSNQLRLPWDNPECYGGRIVYELDNGDQIEITRNFDRRRETVKIFDLTNAEDITAGFTVEKNRESTFAETQLGLTKKVFLNVATIDHLNLDGLGDNEALVQIREKILSLADSGEEEGSADAALKLMKARITSIGQSTARTKPLPMARIRLHELLKELDDTIGIRNELSGIEEQRRVIIDEVERLQKQKEKFEAELVDIDKLERADRVKEAEKLSKKIDEITQECFALGGVREFSLEKLPDIQRDKNFAATAEIQLHRTENEYEQLKRQLKIELERLGLASDKPAEEISMEKEQALADLESKIKRLQERQEESAATRSSVQERMDKAENELDNLPDFSKLSSNPIEWVTQLTSSYDVAEKLRDEEKDKLERLTENVDLRRQKMSSSESVFADCTDFLDKIREYELNSRGFNEQTSKLKTEIENLESILEEHEERIPGHKWMAITCLVFLAGLLYVAFTQTPWAGLPASLAALTLLWFLGNWAYAKACVRRSKDQIESAAMQMDETEVEDKHGRGEIEEMMNELDCETPRELEAAFDKYREAKAELAGVMQTRDEVEERYNEAESKLSELFESMKDSFETLGDKLELASDVQNASTRIISRYQEYRDAKRRFSENKELYKRQSKEYDEIEDELNKLLREERDLSLDMRKIMRENDYNDEKKHASALSAVRAYRIRNSQARQRQGRVEVLREKAHAMEKQIEFEGKDLDRLQEILNKRLKEVGAENVEQCHELAEGARKYQELWKERRVLKEKIDSLLQGKTISELKESIENDGVPNEYPQQDATDLRHEIALIIERIEELAKEEHKLHILLTEKAAGGRFLSEVEEDLDEARWRVSQLDYELEATSYAMTVIEEAARRKHSQIAPRLASIASEYLSEITNGVYDELLVNRDLQVSVRIPQTRTLDDEPGRFLSTGTVDQIYLALRLAMIAGMSEDGERIPMLLDDPFSSYDDFRLENSMRLLARVAQESQVLLFTCRDDVVEAGKAVNAAIINL